MQFTLVSTVFNEYNRLGQTIADIENQTLQPSEIIITDAGSTDGTYEMLLDWKIRSAIPVIVLQKHKCNVAEGRNMAIRHATYDLIASTDFGCRFHQDWLSSIMTPFSNGDVKVVGGSYTVEEDEQNTQAAKAAYIIANGYKTDVYSPWFIPSSRSIAYKKEVFDNIGGYCEWLTLAGDDLVFGMEIKSKGYKVNVIDKPYVFWGRHKVAKGFIKEANRYGLGDGEANVNFRNFIRTLAEYLSLIVLALVFLVCLAEGPRLWGNMLLSIILIFIVLVSVYNLRPVFHLLKNWINLKSEKYDLNTFLFSIYLLYATKYSYIKGYIKGYWFSTADKKRSANVLKTKLDI
jgi:glycosyltransferase involved in cell wall biosynthesis